MRSLGIDFVAVANETPESHNALREKLDLPYSLLTDPDAELAKGLNAFHENEPKGRSIARPGMFLVDTADNGNTILWEHVSPTTRHRVPPSRIIQDILTVLGRKRQLVSVVVPSETELQRSIASYQDPPLGFYRTPGHYQGSARVEREFTRELAMAAFNEIHRLTDEGWDLKAVVPEVEGARNVGHRYVFARTMTDGD